MNVLVALVVIAFAAAAGGVGNGFFVYGGVVLPKTEKRIVTLGTPGNTRETKVSLWIPGVIGQALFGALAGIVVFCVYSQPAAGITVHTNVNLTLYQLGTALLAGLAGSVAVTDLIDRKQWSKLAPILNDSDPAVNQPQALLHGVRALDTFRQLGRSSSA